MQQHAACRDRDQTVPLAQSAHGNGMWHRAESVGAQAAACAAAGWTCRAIVAQASPPPQLHPPGDPTSAPALAVETMEIGGNGMGVALNEWLVRTAKPDAARAQGETVGGAQTSHDGSAARAARRPRPARGRRRRGPPARLRAAAPSRRCPTPPGPRRWRPARQPPGAATWRSATPQAGPCLIYKTWYEGSGCSAPLRGPPPAGWLSAPRMQRRSGTAASAPPPARGHLEERAQVARAARAQATQARIRTSTCRTGGRNAPGRVLRTPRGAAESSPPATSGAGPRPSRAAAAQPVVGHAAPRV